MMQLVSQSKVSIEVELSEGAYKVLAQYIKDRGEWNTFIESAISAALLKKLADQL